MNHTLKLLQKVAWSEIGWSNFNVWFILEFHITQMLISTTSRFECISRLIKVLVYIYKCPKTRLDTHAGSSVWLLLYFPRPLTQMFHRTFQRVHNRFLSRLSQSITPNRAWDKLYNCASNPQQDKSMINSSWNEFRFVN
jgi:hypothetical protein